MSTSAVSKKENRSEKIDFTNLSQFLNMDELSEHVISLQEEAKADKAVGRIEIPLNQAFFLFELTVILRDKLHIMKDVAWVNSRIITSFLSNEDFVSLFSLTKKFRFSMSELIRLRNLDEREQRMLKNLIIASKRRTEISSKVTLVKMELTQNEDAIYDLDGESAVLSDLHSLIHHEFKKLFPSVELEKNMKMTLVRSCLISLVYSNM